MGAGDYGNSWARFTEALRSSLEDFTVAFVSDDRRAGFVFPCLWIWEIDCVFFLPLYWPTLNEQSLSRHGLTLLVPAVWSEMHFHQTSHRSNESSSPVFGSVLDTLSIVQGLSFPLYLSNSTSNTNGIHSSMSAYRAAEYHASVKLHLADIFVFSILFVFVSLK